MYMVRAIFWQVSLRGTPNEHRTLGEYAGQVQHSGPFETRASAEAFARGLATQDLIARVEIYDQPE